MRNRQGGGIGLALWCRNTTNRQRTTVFSLGTAVSASFGRSPRSYASTKGTGNCFRVPNLWVALRTEYLGSGSPRTLGHVPLTNKEYKSGTQPLPSWR